MIRYIALVFLCALLGSPAVAQSDEALLDRVQQQTFNYFWEGGEPISGAAPERIHEDVYPQDDADVVTSGGTGFGIMATIAAIERGYISRKTGRKRLQKLAEWLRDADRFHGAWAHWMYPSGKVKPFSRYDDGGDLVETAFLVQGLIVARQYFRNGNKKERELAELMDKLWREVEWSWYTQDENVLYWHWSPTHGWRMNFAVTGYNECTIMYILAAASPTYPIDPAVWHEGYMRNGEIVSNESAYGYDVVLDHNGEQAIPVGPLFWAHYSFLGLNPKGLHDSYADYWELNRSHALIHHAYAVENPREYEGYSEACWGMTASYSPGGYTAHHPSNDLGVITPTAALSSFPYTPEESMAFLRYLYEKHPGYIGKYGPYDAFSEQSGWCPPRYLAIDQLPIPVMIENHRSGLIWELFMSAPEIQEGLKKLDIQKHTTTK
ncbi:MAG: glucoamylase family protein [Phaeodactylibacter sp.]|uniref:glucoamylase family protein n=1 Tax=Phaeodactylibacter sp. TaxID=1940289 RepID=UPI0032EEC9E6